jgi:hypothetical protein
VEQPHCPPTGSRSKISLMKALGMNVDATILSSTYLERYSTTSNNPLSADQVRVLAALFGWAPLDGLEEAPVLPC